MEQIIGRYRVSDEDIALFKRDGAICLRNVVDAETVAMVRGASLDVMNNGTGHVRSGAADQAAGPRFFTSTFLANMDDRFRDFALRSIIPNVAAQMMQVAQVRFFYDQLFIKEPGTGSITAWHNDLPYWPLRGNDILSFWVALTPVDAQSSGVQYVAGSHRWGRMFQAITPDMDPAFLNPEWEPAPNYFDPQVRGDNKLLSWDLEPGDVLVHHPLTVHGAAGNASADRMRIGLSLRYMGDDARWDPREYVMTPPVKPDVAAGAYPADDRAFPMC